jgi:hypothetical protein
MVFANARAGTKTGKRERVAGPVHVRGIEAVVIRGGSFSKVTLSLRGDPVPRVALLPFEPLNSINHS